MNLTGRTFGNLIAKTRIEKSLPPKWLCQCKCGSLSEIRTADLTQGRVTECTECHDKLTVSNTSVDVFDTVSKVSTVSNTSTDNVILEDNGVYIRYKGMVMSVDAWSEFTDIPTKTIMSRLYSEWTLNETFKDAVYANSKTND